MSVYDRGTQKWTSIMLPEHVEMLEDLIREEELKEKPIVDEQMKAENYVLMQDALQSDSKVRIKYYADHDYHFEDGYLLSIDAVNKIVFMEETHIMFDDIIEVSLL